MIKTILLIIVTIFVPPLGVLAVAGCGIDFIINILLTCLGYFPGHIHAFYLEYVYYKKRDEARAGIYTSRAPGVYSEKVQQGGYPYRSGSGNTWSGQPNNPGSTTTAGTNNANVPLPTSAPRSVETGVTTPVGTGTTGVTNAPGMTGGTGTGTETGTGTGGYTTTSTGANAVGTGTMNTETAAVNTGPGTVTSGTGPGMYGNASVPPTGYSGSGVPGTTGGANVGVTGNGEPGQVYQGYLPSDVPPPPPQSHGKLGGLGSTG
ncbi:UPF0057-domain-containing protein [Sporormia fimetaria CBS 119925]|uniref:UPF0057-domain-containing protein n=1 Tax=Sporormia fimetaria CBS 119925 TaxID=1340428 RepID=A0A6A6VA68_9PLEO|nr:UPF0057-domain-containing protein [Sporormia fimetaria CBS 119925]